MRRPRFLPGAALLLAAGPLLAADHPAEERLAAAVEQLRAAAGGWNVVTEFLDPDGSVSSTVEGTYEFEWVVPGRVLTGTSDQPSLGQRSGLLFYVNETEMTLEMVSVGADGRLWVMKGPVGSETRYSQPFTSRDGVESQLRFTRFAVEKDGFESRMEITRDGGKTWLPGNHQVFRRAK